MEDWAEIRRLHRAEKMPIKVIARVLGCSKNTVKAALAAEGPPKYSRRPAGSIVDAVEPRIRELLSAYPTMPATVIAERIGWERSIRTLSGRVAELRPAYLPPDPSSRTEYVVGEIAQHDFWFPDITLPVGFGQVRTAAELPVLTMVTGYSRWLSVGVHFFGLGAVWHDRSLYLVGTVLTMLGLAGFVIAAAGGSAAAIALVSGVGCGATLLLGVGLALLCSPALVNR